MKTGAAIFPLALALVPGLVEAVPRVRAVFVTRCWVQLG